MAHGRIAGAARNAALAVAHRTPPHTAPGPLTWPWFDLLFFVPWIWAMAHHPVTLPLYRRLLWHVSHICVTQTFLAAPVP